MPAGAKNAGCRSRFRKCRKTSAFPVLVSKASMLAGFFRQSIQQYAFHCFEPRYPCPFSTVSAAYFSVAFLLRISAASSTLIWGVAIRLSLPEILSSAILSAATTPESFPRTAAKRFLISSFSHPVPDPNPEFSPLLQNPAEPYIVSAPEAYI